MNPYFLFSLLLLLVLPEASYTQTYTWWNPAQHDEPVLEGQAWSTEVESYYDRLPSRAIDSVRKPLWGLSKNGAGLMIRFRTDATEVKVRYVVSGKFELTHMPATGVSGLDLYAREKEGTLHWLQGKRTFGDTCYYHFPLMENGVATLEAGREFILYLPLYNSVQWLEMGVPKGTTFEALPITKEKPIVVYGTSIAQGACASRPGMAWTAILGRRLQMPVVNLGFSGNGRLEPEIINLLTEIEAKIYILDCLPNLAINKNRTREEVEKRIIFSVKRLKEKRPDTPIILVEHSGYPDGSLNPFRRKTYTELNDVLQKAYQQLKIEGVTDLHLLTRNELNLGMDSYVDGTHPTDLGMQQIAEAYEKMVRGILKK